MSIQQMMLGVGPKGADYQVERSLRFNGATSDYLDKTFSTGNRKTWTWSGWVKRGALATDQTILGNFDVSGTNGFIFGFTAADKLIIADEASTAYEWELYTNSLFRDPSAWYHLVIAFDTEQSTPADRVKIYVNGVQDTDINTVGAGYPTLDYESHLNIAKVTAIGRSGSNTIEYCDLHLAEVHFIDGQALTPSNFGKTNSDTGEWDPKRYTGGTASYGTNGFYLNFKDSTDLGEDSSGNGNDFTGSTNIITSDGQVFSSGADSTAMHSTGPWTYAFDGNIATGAFTYTTVTSTCTIPRPVTWSTSFEVHGVKYGGSTLKVNDLDCSSLFTTNGADAWVNLNSIVGSSGTFEKITIDDVSTDYFKVNAVRLDGVILTDSTDKSNFSTEVPTRYGDEDTGKGGELRGDYATLNPLHNGDSTTLSDGNLRQSNNTNYHTTISTIGVSSGKWYCEVLVQTANVSYFGVSPADKTDAPQNSFHGQTANSYVWFTQYGLYTNSAYSNMSADWSAQVPAGTVIGIALDMDNGTLKYYQDGNLISGGNAFTGITGTQFMATCSFGNQNAPEIWNFGQNPFYHPAPEGYKCMCTQNLDDTKILSGTYVGNGAADGPFVWMNATPKTLKISSTNNPPQAGDLVTFDPTVVDPLSNGFKIRHASTNNANGTTYYWLAESDNAYKNSNAQSN